MFLRDPYPFDLPVPTADFKYLNSLAVGPSLWWHASELGNVPPNGIAYLDAGLHGGVRGIFVLAETTWAWAPCKFPSTLVRIPGDRVGGVGRLLRRAANRAGQIGAIELVGRLPLFGSDEGGLYHQDGWYSQSPIAYRTSPPAWAGAEAAAWLIREGLYIVFPDKSYRLVRSWEQPLEEAPVARQGDLLIYGESHDSRLIPIADEPEMGRHRVLYSVEGYRVEHPEHATLVLPPEAKAICLAPGTSRPFSRERGDGD